MDLATLIVVVGTGASAVFQAYPQWSQDECIKTRASMSPELERKSEVHRYFCVPGWPLGQHHVLSDADRARLMARLASEQK